MRAALAALRPDELAAALPDHAARLAFWLNVYNAAVRARLLADPSRHRRRWLVFATLRFADYDWTLDLGDAARG